MLNELDKKTLTKEDTISLCYSDVQNPQLTYFISKK